MRTLPETDIGPTVS